MSTPHANARRAPSVLIVGDVSLVGKATGTQRRYLGAIRGLSKIGAVDYVQWGARAWLRRTPVVEVASPTPPLRWHLLLRRHTTPHRLDRAHQLGWTVRALVSRQRPCPPFAVGSAARPSRRTMKRFVPNLSDYDLVWCFGLPSALTLDRAAGSSRPPVIIDVDAVHYVIDALGRTGAVPAAGHRMGHLFEELFARCNGDASRFWIEHLASRAEFVLFTNPREAALFDLGNAAVLHNGCDVLSFHGARAVSARPTLLFVGWMYYPPNAAAAHHLVTDIVPELRRAIGSDFEVRLVGSAPESVRRLASDPNVVVTGYVEDLAGEFERSDLVVAPILTGAGTRVKILEAFSNQIPVVSTTFGASGIDVTDRTHLLFADDAEGFADVCHELLVNAQLRDGVVTNAYELVAQAHDWSVIEGQIADFATRAMETFAGRRNRSGDGCVKSAVDRTQRDHGVFWRSAPSELSRQPSQ
jgi:glycosyltransferase involved in cell wall biosynthesis